MCSNFIFCSVLKELYQTIYWPFSTLLEHTRILVEGLHNSERHIHVFTESKRHFETTKEAGGHFGIELPTETSKHVTTVYRNELELKCHRYLVFLWLFVQLFKEVIDTVHSDTAQCYADTEDTLLSSLGRWSVMCYDPFPRNDPRIYSGICLHSH